MSESGRQQANPTGADAKEGVLIRLLAPTHKSRPRLLILALLLVIWITFLVGLYLSTHSRPPENPASSGVAMAFPQ